jgi:drug/metabolite transporter (DMT)-like permease
MTTEKPVTAAAVPRTSQGIDRGRLAGFALIAGAAACFSMSVIMGRLSYDAGSDPVTVITTRFVLGSLALAALVAMTGRGFVLPRHKLIGALVLGTLITASSLAYFSSIRLIPVSLAVLIFYTFPILVGVATRFTEGAPLTRGKIAALVLAFFGIALALNVDLSGYNVRGLLLATVPALAIGSITLFGGRVLRNADLRVITFYMMVMGTAIMAAVLALGGSLAWPEAPAGWAPLLAVPVLFVVGNLCYFGAFSRLGTVDIAMTMNIEPLTAIIFSALILGDWLTPLQYGGAALVIFAIFLMSALRR